MTKKISLGVYVTILLLFLFSIVLLIICPETRTGPFGIGLPANMKIFISEENNISMKYPESWVAFETPNGNHGDHSVIIWMGVPGRTWPFVSIAESDFINGDLGQVVNWGLNRLNNIEHIQSSSIYAQNTSNLSGKYITYSYQSSSVLFEEKTIQCKSSFFFESARGYMISFCAEKDTWEDLDDTEKIMIESLTFNERK